MILQEDAVWIKQEIDLIPGDSGWWDDDDKGDFLALAVELFDLGLDRCQVIEILARAYWAVANEFGV